MASIDSHNEMNVNSARSCSMRRSTNTPRLPGVARHSRAPVRSRYSAYSSARAASVAPCHTRAISLEPFELWDGAFIADVSGVQGRVRLEEHHLSVLVGDRLMLDAVRDDDEFA